MEIESGEVMNDLTLGLIYAVKHSEKSAKESIIDFLSEYTGTPKQYYSDNELVRIIRDSFVDYLKTADNPALNRSYLFAPFRPLDIHHEVTSAAIRPQHQYKLFRDRFLPTHILYMFFPNSVLCHVSVVSRHLTLSPICGLRLA